MTEHKIVVYSTSTCPYCDMVKDFLKDKGVKFDNKNVGEDVEAAREMIQKSGQRGVPVLDIDGKIVVGFNQDLIDELTN